MKSKTDSVPSERSPPARRRISGGENANEVFGFQVNENQFAVLQSDQSVVSQLPTPREVGLVDPRTTRHLRWATQQAEEQESKTQETTSATVPYSNTQGISNSGESVDPVVYRNCSQFFIDNSFPACSPDILSLQSGGNV